MWNDSKETIVPGGGQAYVGPVGTAQPADESAAVNAAYHGLGYHSEDGASFNKSMEIIRHRAFQSRYEIRRDRGNEDLSVVFSLLQWNEDTLPFALGGGSVEEVSTGHFKYSPASADEELDERSLIVDLDDGDNRLRLVIPKGSITEGVESQFTRESMGVLPVTFQALEPDDGGLPWYFLTNLPGFAAGS